MIDPIAITLGPLTVRWYGIILGTGALIGLLLAIREGKKFRIPPDFFMDLLLIGVPTALIGARIYFVAMKWEDYKDNLGQIFAIWNGGIAIYGALIGAIIGALIYVRKKKYSFWRIADICAPSLLAGQIIGRWGNFVNQEAHGGPVTESFLRNTLHLPDFIVNQMNINGVYYHPTFLYESLWNVMGILILLWLRRRPFLRAGELFMSYFIWYSIGRFFVEGLRTDSLSFSGPAWLAQLMDALWSPMTLRFEPGVMTYGDNIRISQLVGVLIVIAAVIFIIVRRVRGTAKVRYLDPIMLTDGTVLGPVEIKNAKSLQENPAAAEVPPAKSTEKKEPPQ
ncbi:prolipoprotein diacylglyceryl transferase Lgt [Paenibacillus larvae subsp. larvae]|uniref:Phosphatidylglycerol--prolipoprotein diacylglyceryl transferase n=1 Tax=Paenibacillus larvae subsp. larvae TaxID=147375 RepID=A0A2L1U8L8_9BACL|nr:prolipoprotein diacylglyceryl transferase [Paenibacillus larvae]AQT85215.1 prolipoprotein diacylglyceryl transferase [Paenibacillus larvae subsp. pulvifaciens]AQZ47219.1 prolipoprotein diacylglyceryl transferase [Paenibacillus larvae subsp. pulvifaciens]AVF24514.1 prolipoprotein diacylglyceryl transferase Lgt [Paenibacillus larvae subsp. larvae]AVF29275.1 prolipoprotein diacylglyceryl transferase Lgt [Paenibacillus larvae subsp. larvae]MCY7521989.1 prolipoprotein diacylglyceryl transferase 